MYRYLLLYFRLQQINYTRRSYLKCCILTQAASADDRHTAFSGCSCGELTAFLEVKTSYLSSIPFIIETNINKRSYP